MEKNPQDRGKLRVPQPVRKCRTFYGTWALLLWSKKVR